MIKEYSETNKEKEDKNKGLKIKILDIENCIKKLEKVNTKDISDENLEKISKFLYEDGEEKEKFLKMATKIKCDPAFPDKFDLGFYLKEVMDLKIEGLKKKKENFEKSLTFFSNTKKNKS